MIPTKIKTNRTFKKKPVSNKKMKIINCGKSEGTRTKWIKNKSRQVKLKEYIVEYYDLTVLEKRHFVGAMLLELEEK